VTYFNVMFIFRPKHRAYYLSGRPVIKIGPKGALGSHEIRPIHFAPSLGQSITSLLNQRRNYNYFKIFIYYFTGLRRYSTVTGPYKCRQRSFIKIRERSGGFFNQLHATGYGFRSESLRATGRRHV